MTDPVRMGVVGTGNVALRGLLPHLTEDDNDDSVQVTAVCDLDRERAEKAADQFEVPDAYERYETLLESGDVDAVTLATPIGLHYEQGRRAIEHGVHVHFNKTLTFCTTLEEANDLIEFAERQDVKLVASPGQMTRPREQRLRTLVDERLIGRVTWAATGAAFGHVDYGEYHLKESFRGGDDVLSNVDPSWYYRKPGGGPLYDMTVYNLHSLTGILGPAERVTARSGVRIPEREFQGETIRTEMDDSTFILVEFGDALTAFVYGAAHGELPGVGDFLINGTEGQINTEPSDGVNGTEGQVTVAGANTGAIGDADANELPHVTGPHRGRHEFHVYEDIMQLVDWIRDGTPPLATVEHARHVVEIIDKAYQSAESGATEPLETEFEFDTDLLEHA